MRASLHRVGQLLLFPEDPSIIAVATRAAFGVETPLLVLDLDSRAEVAQPIGYR